MERSTPFREGLGREKVTEPAAAAPRGGSPRRSEAASGMPSAAGTSRAAAAALGVVLACALALALVPGGFRDGALLPIAALGAALAAAPLVLRGEALAPAAAALSGVGRGAFYLVAFALSFVPVAEALRLRSATSPGFLAALPPFLLALAAVAVGLRRGAVDAHARGEAMLLTATVLAFAAGLFLETGKGVAVVASLSLAFLAMGRLVRGVSWMARGAFWEGLLVGAVLAGSRIAEVPLAGWPRATGAFLVAAGATAAALVFERRRWHEQHEAQAHP
jgi:hypothetical protein